MNEVYILTIVKEIEHDHPEIQTSVHSNMESALRAYDIAVDEARGESLEHYGMPHEDNEIATDSYRYFRIEDMLGVEVITIEVQTKEIIGGDSDDI